MTAVAALLTAVVGLLVFLQGDDGDGPSASPRRRSTRRRGSGSPAQIGPADPRATRRARTVGRGGIKRRKAKRRLAQTSQERADFTGLEGTAVGRYYGVTFLRDLVLWFRQRRRRRRHR
jgi:hypothetical protein